MSCFPSASASSTSNSPASEASQLQCKHKTIVRHFVVNILGILGTLLEEPEKDECFNLTGHATHKNAGKVQIRGKPPMKSQHPLGFVSLNFKHLCPIADYSYTTPDVSLFEKLQKKKADWYPVYYPINLESVKNKKSNIRKLIAKIIKTQSLLFVGESLDDDSYDAKPDEDDGCDTLQPLKIHEKGYPNSNAFLRDGISQSDLSAPMLWMSSLFTTPSWRYAISEELASIIHWKDLPFQVQMLIECLQEPYSFKAYPASISLENLSLKNRDPFISAEELEYATSHRECISPYRLLIRFVLANNEKQKLGRYSGMLNGGEKIRANFPERVELSSSTNASKKENSACVGACRNITSASKSEISSRSSLNAAKESVDSSWYFDRNVVVEYIRPVINNSDFCCEVVNSCGKSYCEEDLFRSHTSYNAKCNLSGCTAPLSCSNTASAENNSQKSSTVSNFFPSHTPGSGALWLRFAWSPLYETIKNCMKRCINTKELKYDQENNCWVIPEELIYEAVKFTLHVGGSVEILILEKLHKLLLHYNTSASSLLVPKLSNKENNNILPNAKSSDFLKLIKTSDIWGYQRIYVLIPIQSISKSESTKEECSIFHAIQPKIDLSSSSHNLSSPFNSNEDLDSNSTMRMIQIRMSPFNLSLTNTFKTHKLCTWNAKMQLWVAPPIKLDIIHATLVKKTEGQFFVATQNDQNKIQILIQSLQNKTSRINEGRHTLLDYSCRSSFHSLANEKKNKKMRYDYFCQKGISRTRGGEEGAGNMEMQEKNLSNLENVKRIKNFEATDSDLSEENNEQEKITRKISIQKKDQIDKIKFVVCANQDCYEKITYKVKEVLRRIKPPRYGYNSKMKLVRDAPGTGGFELLSHPSNVNEWSNVSFLIVPNYANGKIPIDKYNPKLLCSLVGHVFILQEAALDFLLKNYERWPGPDDHYNFEQWNKILQQNEPRDWGDKTLDERQALADAGLFSDTDFFLCGPSNNKDYKLCKLLISLGEGTIVDDPDRAEYVIITDEKYPEASEIQKAVGYKEEEKVASTHGARHSVLVSPKFIYDCILEWILQRPSPERNHTAFREPNAI